MAKIVVFDLDDLLIDTEDRKRAYNLDMEHTEDPTLIEDSYELGEYYSLDKPLPMALISIQVFENMEYDIAYLSGRRESSFDWTCESLESMGFPVDKKLVFLKSHKSEDTTEHKTEILTSLLDAGHEVEYYFDDDELNLAAADDIGIPNLYSSTSAFFNDAIDWE